MILIAKIEKGIVYIKQDSAYYKADDVDFFCDAKADSQGVVLIDGMKKRYITDTQIDLNFSLQKVVDMIKQVKLITDNATYIIAAQAQVVGKIPSFAPISLELEAISKEIKDHKTI